MFVGQGSVREAVIGRVDRKATPAEIEQMKALVRQGMRDGAFGISSGLFYVPGIFTPSDEVVAVSAAAGAMGGIYISHMRNEAAHILESVAETIAVGEAGPHADADHAPQDHRDRQLGQERRDRFRWSIRPARAAWT